MKTLWSAMLISPGEMLLDAFIFMFTVRLTITPKIGRVTVAPIFLKNCDDAVTIPRSRLSTAFCINYSLFEPYFFYRLHVVLTTKQK